MTNYCKVEIGRYNTNFRFHKCFTSYNFAIFPDFILDHMDGDLTLYLRCFMILLRKLQVLNGRGINIFNNCLVVPDIFFISNNWIIRARIFPLISLETSILWKWILSWNRTAKWS